MTKKVLAAVALVSLGLTAGCGSNSSPATSTTAISGKVADGYLSNAMVFMDRNRNYQLDAGEPSTVTDGKGDFTLLVNPMEIGKHPIVAMAVGDKTMDLDNGQKVAMSYLMSLPASAVSATGTSFVSPISTLVREKMEAQTGMTLSEAMTELRNQMNLPAGMNVMADYVKLGAADSTDPNRAVYSMMHGAAQNMASLMVGEASKVMGMAGKGTTVDVNRFRAMMGAMNLQLPQMISAMQNGVQQNQAVMNQMMTNMANAINAVPPMVAGMPFRNMSSLFPPMMNISFWNMTGGRWTTRNPGGAFWNMTTHYNFGSMMPGSTSMVSGMGSVTSMGSRMMGN